MDEQTEQALNGARADLENARRLLGDTEYERAAVNVTLAYRKLQPFTSHAPGIVELENSLIEVARAPFTDPTKSETWLGLTDEVWTHEKVEEQIRFLDGVVRHLERS